MTDPMAEHEATMPDDPDERAQLYATAYVKQWFTPPLPEAYGPWLVTLATHAEQGMPPETRVPVPAAVVQTGTLPPGTARDEHGNHTTTLREALKHLRQEELLNESDTDCVEYMQPAVALTLANTADVHTVATEWDPEAVCALAGELTAGRWVVYPESPIRVDEQARLVHGLNLLLAIVRANTVAPVAIVYGYDATANSPAPALTYRSPVEREA